MDCLMMVCEAGNEGVSGARLVSERLRRFQKYIAEIPAFIARHSGKYIVQGTRPTTIEGDWKPERMVILEFPAREKAEAFLSDPEIHDTTTSKLGLVDGCT